MSRDAVLKGFEGLLSIGHVHVEQEELVLHALEWHRQGFDFADALHLARNEGCSALMSFDRSLVRSAAELGLSPSVREPWG